MTDPDRLIRDLAASERAGILCPLLGVLVIVLAAWVGAIMVWGIA